MKITNKNNLPEPMLNFVQQDGYKSTMDTIRVTELLKGVREVWLTKRHYDELEQDVSEMIWMMFGTALHSILEASEEEGHQIKEARLSEKIGDLTLSGGFDLYDGKKKKVIDYKTCSVWKVIYGDLDDWKKQTAIYSWLLTKAGFEVTGTQIVALMKDHSIGKARWDAAYPSHPVQVFEFPYTDREAAEIETFIMAKMQEFAETKDLPDDELPVCSDDERWYSGDKYAVMKGKNKRALRVLDTEKEAEQWMESNEDKGGTHIEHRKGENRKCLDYCGVADFCSFYHKEVKNG